MWKYITCNSVWLCWNIFEILKLISTFWRHVLCVFSIRKIFRKCKNSRGRLKLIYKPALGNEVHVEVTSILTSSHRISKFLLDKLIFDRWYYGCLSSNDARKPGWRESCTTVIVFSRLKVRMVGRNVKN